MNPLLLCVLLGQGAMPVPPDPTPVPTPVPTPSRAPVVIDGQFRFRVEYRDPMGYDTAPAVKENDDLFLSRIRINFRHAAQENIDLFAQVQDSRDFGGEASVTSNEKNIDLKQGWVEVRRLLDQPLALKIGRQEVAYGDGRVLSPLDWSNIGRSFDGARARHAGEGYWVDLFYYVVREGSAAEDDHDFGGGYASYTGVKDHEFDAYLLLREFNTQTFTGEDGNPGDLRDRTAGLRVKGRQEALDYGVEAAFQSGDFATDSVRAYGASLTAGWTFDPGWKSRIGIEVTQASGDSDPADGDRGTFDPLFPFGHFYQGFADQFSYRNGRDVALYLKAAPGEGVTLHADFHTFTLMEEKDAWYNAAGTVIRRDATGNSDAAVGHEIDLHLRWAATAGLKIWTGGSYFIAGKFVEDTGPSPDMFWFFLQALFDF